MLTPIAIREAGTSADAESRGISVIIPVLNESKVIGKCLDALAACRVPVGCVEVIVVDNGSSDDTVAIARSYSDCLNLRVIERPGVTISALRNAGAAEARYELLAFVDADCLAPAHWLESIASTLRSASAAIVGGNYAIPPASGWLARTWYGTAYRAKSGETDYVPAGNMMVNRSVFRQIGGFDESLQTAEDWELCRRARKLGHTVLCCTDMAVLHLGTPQSVLRFYRKERWHGCHVVQMLLNGPITFASVRTVLFAAYTLLSCIFTLAALVWSLISGHFIGFAVALPMMLAAPFVCALRKLRAVPPAIFFSSLLPLAYLHFVYGLARASSLFSVERSRFQDQHLKQSVSKVAA